MVKNRALLLATTLAVALSAAPLIAGEADLARNAQVDLLPGWRAKNGDHMAALRVRLAPGWKTYWRAPGEGGIPPRFSWAGSRNIKQVDFHWPTPHVWELNGMRSIGYKNELILPISITPRTPGAPIALRTELEIGVCLDICMPLTVTLRADLPAGGQADPAISAALKDQPVSARAAGVTSVKCSAEPIRDGLRFTAAMNMPQIARDEFAAVELADQTIWIAPTETSRAGQTLTTVTDMVPQEAAPFLLDRSSVRITIFGAGGAVDIQGCKAS